MGAKLLVGPDAAPDRLQLADDRREVRGIDGRHRDRRPRDGGCREKSAGFDPIRDDRELSGVQAFHALYADGVVGSETDASAARVEEVGEVPDLGLLA